MLLVAALALMPKIIDYFSDQFFAMCRTNPGQDHVKTGRTNGTAEAFAIDFIGSTRR